MGEAVRGPAATSLDACQDLTDGTIATRSKENKCFYVKHDGEMIQWVFAVLVLRIL